MRGAKAGLCTAGDGGMALATARLIFACRHQPATGPGRAGQIGGPAGRSPSGDGIGSGWAEDRGAASARPALGARTTRAVLVPVVSVLFPAPGRGLPGPGTGPGKAVRAVR
jgi:hypothetical protein